MQKDQLSNSRLGTAQAKLLGHYRRLNQSIETPAFLQCPSVFLIISEHVSDFILPLAQHRHWC